MKRLLYLLFCLSLIITFSITVQAEDGNKIYYADKIPDFMLPLSEIEFVDSKHFVILKGGFNNLKEKTVPQEADLPNEIKEAVKHGIVITQDYPEPKEGIKISYADDGYIQKISVNGKDYEGEDNQDNVMKKIKTRGIVPTVYSWGKHKNTIAISNGVVMGSGRGTTFTDKIGQKNWKLRKGDVATKAKYDNVRFGLDVTVEANHKKTKKKVRKILKKHDIGGMPDAVVDIWKTGCSYWGYTYSASTSINKVTIAHAAIY